MNSRLLLKASIGILLMRKQQMNVQMMAGNATFPARLKNLG